MGSYTPSAKYNCGEIVHWVRSRFGRKDKLITIKIKLDSQLEEGISLSTEVYHRQGCKSELSVLYRNGAWYKKHKGGQWSLYPKGTEDNRYWYKRFEREYPRVFKNQKKDSINLDGTISEETTIELIVFDGFEEEK
jgi:hypothetical protein